MEHYQVTPMRDESEAVIVPIAKRPEERREPSERQWQRRTWREKGKRVHWVGRR